MVLGCLNLSILGLLIKTTTTKTLAAAIMLILKALSFYNRMDSRITLTFLRIILCTQSIT